MNANVMKRKMDTVAVKLDGMYVCVCAWMGMCVSVCVRAVGAPLLGRYFRFYFGENNGNNVGSSRRGGG